MSSLGVTKCWMENATGSGELVMFQGSTLGFLQNDRTSSVLLQATSTTDCCPPCFCTGRRNALKGSFVLSAINIWWCFPDGAKLRRRFDAQFDAKPWPFQIAHAETAVQRRGKKQFRTVRSCTSCVVSVHSFVPCISSTHFLPDCCFHFNGFRVMIKCNIFYHKHLALKENKQVLLLVPLQRAAARCFCQSAVCALELGCWCCCRVPLQGATSGCRCFGVLATFLFCYLQFLLA